MTFQDKLRLHLAEKDVTWTFDGSRAVASWNEAGPRLLVGVSGTLAAAAVLDAYVQAQAQQAHLTVVHDGQATPVALRTASRFGVTLLDATHWPVPAPTVVEPEPFVEAPAPESPLAALPEVVPASAPVAIAEVAPEIPVAAEAAAEPELLLAAPEPVLLLVAHAEEMPAPAEPAQEAVVERVAEVASEFAIEALAALLPEAAAEPEAVAVEVAPPEPVAVEPAPEAPVAEAAPEPVVAPAPEPSAPAEPVADFIEATSFEPPTVAHASAEAGLPWEPVLAAAEPAAVLTVTQEELASLPWATPTDAPAAEEDHVELLPGNARPRQYSDHPTAMTAASWGLPWPRPVAPSDGLAIADPRIWKTAERIHAVREDLDKVGAPSFGAAPTEGSAWLKRLSQFGP